MDRRRFHIGPGAASLLLIVVVMSMSVLGMLALISANADLKLSMRGAEMTQRLYTLDDKAEKSLMAFDALLAECATLNEIEARLPEEMTLEDDLVFWTETDETEHVLYCELRLTQTEDGLRYTRTAFRHETEDESIFSEDESPMWVGSDIAMEGLAE